MQTLYTKPFNQSVNAILHRDTLTAKMEREARRAVPTVTPEKVTVSVISWSGVHDHLPQGGGTWKFQVGREVVALPGKYNDCLIQVRHYAAAAGVDGIEVIP